MFRELFKNKDLLVFWVTIAITAFDVLPLDYFSIPEVTAAPSNFSVSADNSPYRAAALQQTTTVGKKEPADSGTHFRSLTINQR